jgi:hypothetical protein
MSRLKRESKKKFNKIFDNKNNKKNSNNHHHTQKGGCLHECACKAIHS